MNPMVSAVILTHNRKQLVMRAIDSVLSQTYPNMECIVVDDASADGTKELLSARKDIQYIYIPKEESKGGNYARNMGIKASKGEYVAFLDDDDCWLPTKIEKQVALIEEKGCDLVYCGMRPEYMHADGTITYVDWPPREDGQGDMSKKILSRIYLITSGIMARKSLLDKVGGFDDRVRYWQEYELSIRLAQYTEFYAVEECLYLYRIDEQDKNKLTNKFDAWKGSAQYIHKKHRALYQQLPLAAKIDASRLYNGEACNRAKKAGLKFTALYHKIICVILKRVRYVIK